MIGEGGIDASPCRGIRVPFVEQQTDGQIIEDREHLRPVSRRIRLRSSPNVTLPRGHPRR